MRNGERWYYNVCEIFLKELGKESVYYRGFKNVQDSDGRYRLVGLFETVSPDLNLSKFEKKYKDYINKEGGILGITVHKNVGTYRNCIVVWLR